MTAVVRRLGFWQIAGVCIFLAIWILGITRGDVLQIVGGILLLIIGIGIGMTSKQEATLKELAQAIRVGVISAIIGQVLWRIRYITEIIPLLIAVGIALGVTAILRAIIGIVNVITALRTPPANQNNQ
jgi:hypothetical protein